MDHAVTTRKDETPTGAARPDDVPVVTLEEHIIEIVSDSGEGAQRCGQTFGSIAAKMGNGIWTVEIIPAEIQPSVRSIEGTSGNRIRVGSGVVTNGGDAVDLVAAFNEQVVLGRVRAKELKPGCIILLENSWRTNTDQSIAASYTTVYEELVGDGYRVYEIPMEQECLKYVTDPRRGKNMFVLGVLSRVYCLDRKLALTQVALTFAKQGLNVIAPNQELLRAGWDWAEVNLDIRFRIPPSPIKEPRLVVNGNTALGLGVMASGMEVCSMYPITPATSVSHYLSDVFQRVGGIVHQAEDEIAACTFAIGASYAGKCAVTITSGPGYSLKQEGIGLAVMGEIPLVVVNVQRGGPSTGQPTKCEQGDLLAACFGGHGDAPKVVMAVSDIEDCFYSVIMARKIAETFNMVVVLLSDASLGTAQQPFPRPKFSEDWLAPPVDQSPVPEGTKPYAWDPETGLASRIIPGQPNGMYCLTGLAHDSMSHIIYDPEENHEAIRRRSLKLAALQKSLKPPKLFGDEQGELLIVGWGGTKGAIEEAVRRVRADGHRVSSLHIKFLQPMASGIKEILQQFDQVIAVENNWSDDLNDALIDDENRRYSNLAWLLRARFLVDVDCWSEVKSQPLKPGAIERAIRAKLA